MDSLSLRSSLLMLLALPFACGDDDGEAGENESVVADNGWATQGVSESATSTSSTGSTSGPTSGPTSGSGSTATETAADSTTGPDVPVVCTEDLTCNPGEVCVLPCCGGPAPGCFLLPAGGDCGNGTLDEGGGYCCQNDPDPTACMKMQWCIDGPCMAAPPYCTPMDTLTCTDFDCTAPDGCYGDLIAGQLQCSCK